MKIILALCLLLSTGLRSEGANGPFEAKTRNTVIKKLVQSGQELLAAKDYNAALLLFKVAGDHLDSHDKSIWLGAVEAMQGAGMAAEALVTLDEFKNKFGESPELIAKAEAIKKAYPDYQKRYDLLTVLSKEKSTRQNLSAIRSALAMYAADNKGAWPKSLTEAPFLGTYVDMIPPEKITGSKQVAIVWDGKGGWLYDPKTGEVQVNLTGKDSKGKEFKAYPSIMNQTIFSAIPYY